MGEALAIIGALVAVLGPMVWFLRRQVTRVSRTLLAHLGVRARADVRLVAGTKLTTLHEPDALRALRDGLPALGFQVESIGLHSMVASVSPPSITLGFMLADCFQRGFGQPHSSRFETAPGTFEDLPSGLLWLCTRGDLKLALVLMKNESLFANELWIEAAVGSQPGAEARAREVLAQLERWMSGNSIYKGQTVAPAATPSGAVKLGFANVSLTPGLVFDDVLKDDLELNFLAFVRHGAQLAKMGIPSRRGLLLCGPPGTGKTSTCRYLRSQLPQHTFLVASAQAVAGAHALFDLAGRLAPSVVVIEDVDLALRTPEPSLPNPTLRDLLNEIDGLEDRADVMVVLTSNSRLPLEQALADRPGRIDHTIAFRPPGVAHRKNLLAACFKDAQLLMPLDDLVQMTEGLTPAQLTELVKKSAIRAIRRAAPGDVQISQLDVRAALDELNADGQAARGNKDTRPRPLPIH